jgi:hypothetical protein
MGIVYLSLVMGCCTLLGVVIGLIVNRAQLKTKIEQAREQAREEADKDKATLSENLNEQLDRIRQSIIQSAEAYQSAVESVGLHLSPRSTSAIEAAQIQTEKQLKLEFENTGKNSSGEEQAKESSDEDNSLLENLHLKNNEANDSSLTAKH